jgi:hypothetical protein
MEAKMYQQRLSQLFPTNPLNVAVILIIVIGLMIGGLIGLQAARNPLANTSPATRLAPLSRAQSAEAARYQALASQHYNLYGSTAWTRAPKSLTRAQIADAARLTALAIHFGRPPASISPDIAAQIAP